MYNLYIMDNKKTDKTKVIRIFEAFAGLGAQRKALKNIEANFKVSGMAEWFVPAIISYQAIHNGLTKAKVDKKTSLEKIKNYLESKTLSMNSKDPVKPGYWSRKKESDLRMIFTAVKMSEAEGNIFDVRTLHKRRLSDIDLLTYSFPCQDLSQQGKQLGMKKDSGTRSGLLWEIEKSLDATPKSNLPKFLLLENVMALNYKTNAHDLKLWMMKLEKLGYKNSIKVLNAADFGSSQARRRVFMLSTLNRLIDLPSGKANSKPIYKILDKNISNELFLPKLDKYQKTEFKLTKSNINKAKLIGYTTFNSEAFIYDKNFAGPTLTASGANSRIKILDGKKIRKLNARESYKYMGFDTTDHKKVESLNFLSDTKKIYTCGNSISVEVLMSIFKEVLNG